MTDEEVRTTPAGSGRLVAPTRMRKAIARTMTASKREIPHFYVSADIAMDPLLATARELNTRRDGGPKITVTALLLHRLAATLRAHPAFNAVATEEGFVQVDAINIGVAIALDEGLIAPAILDCGSLDPTALAGRLEDLVSRARAGRLRPDELSGPTFTLSNLGTFPVTSFAAIVPPPQVAILATGRAEHAGGRRGRRPSCADDADRHDLRRPPRGRRGGGRRSPRNLEGTGRNTGRAYGLTGRGGAGRRRRHMRLRTGTFKQPY